MHKKKERENENKRYLKEKKYLVPGRERKGLERNRNKNHQTTEHVYERQHFLFFFFRFSLPYSVSFGMFSSVILPVWATYYYLALLGKVAKRRKTKCRKSKYRKL